MKKISLQALVSFVAIFMLGQPYHAEGQLPDISVVSTTCVQVRARNTDGLRKLIAEFARQHGFSHGQESTMPRHRKIFLVAGAFSTTFASKDDYYLLAHNLVGRDRVSVDLYAARSNPALEELMANLRQAIKEKMSGKAKIVDSDRCNGESPGSL